MENVKKLTWCDIDNNLKPFCCFKRKELHRLSKSSNLCMTDESIVFLDEKKQEKNRQLMDKVCLYVSVFADIKPFQKESVVKALKRANGGILMCGDGANDVAALER